VNIRSADVIETALAIGSALIVLVYAGGYISGALYNPAVSFAVWIRGKLNFIDMIVYIVVQIVAAFIGALVVYGLFGQTFAFPGPTVPSLFTVWRALLAEFIFTLILANTALHTGTKQDGNSFFGLAIGAALLAAILAIGDISGACLNPAVATGYSLIQAMAGAIGSTYNAGYVWIYWVAPMLGGLFAALFFKVALPKDSQVETLN
jgi:aquaporin Z